MLVTEKGWYRGNDLKGLKGDRGDKGEKGDGVADIGTAPLETQSQTIKEAINEILAKANSAFQSGNSTKEDVVAQLLLKDPKLPITSSSTWEEIKLAISKIKTVITPIGQEVTAIASEKILEGNLVTIEEQFKHNHASLSGLIDYTNLKKNKLCIFE